MAATTQGPLDRSSAVPLWAQLLDDLRRRLASGELTDRFPTDRELTEHYGVSRQTARDAVRHLREEGLVTRERGRGSFVRQPTIEQSLGALYSLFRSIEDQGFTQRSEVRHLVQRRDEEAAGHLGLHADAPLVFVERVRFADDEPVAVDCSWLPATRALPLLSADLTHTALYAELADRCGVRITGGSEHIRPAMATAEQRRLLGIRPRQPVFAIERLAVDDHGPVEWRHAVVRGDRYAFTASWGADAQAPVLSPSPDPYPG